MPGSGMRMRSLGAVGEPRPRSIVEEQVLRHDTEIEAIVGLRRMRGLLDGRNTNVDQHRRPSPQVPSARHHLRTLTRAVAEQPEEVQQEITRRIGGDRTSQRD